MRIFDKEVAATIVRSSDKQIVMGVKRPYSNGVYHGFWILPGGIVDPGETALEAAYRETLDETGLDLSAYEARLVDDTGSDKAELTLRSGERILYQMRFTTYQVDIDKIAEEVELRASDELAKVEWVPVTNLTKYNLCPPSIILFRKLGYLSLSTG